MIHCRIRLYLKSRRRTAAPLARRQRPGLSLGEARPTHAGPRRRRAPQSDTASYAAQSRCGGQLSSSLPIVQLAATTSMVGYADH